VPEWPRPPRIERVILDWRGESRTIPQWSPVVRIPARDIYHRIVHLYWDVESALTRRVSRLERTRAGEQRRIVREEAPAVRAAFDRWRTGRVRIDGGRDMDAKGTGELIEIAEAERAAADIDKKRRLTEEFVTECVRKGTADPDRVHLVIEEFLRGPEAMQVAPSFMELILDGPGIEAGATRVRDLMIDAIRHGDDLTLLQAVSICEGIAAQLVYREHPLTADGLDPRDR
jgi:hypothetical protein